MKTNSKTLFFSMTYEYLEIYMPERLGRSVETIRSYRDALTVFRKYLFEEKGISVSKFEMAECTTECLDEFVSFLKKNGCKPGTCNQRLAAIKSYLWFAADKNISLQSIAISVSKAPSCKVTKKDLEIIPQEALAALFKFPPNTKMGIRDRLIMIMLYDSAVRVNELLSIQIKDVNLNTRNPYIFIHGKGNKERIVALSEKTVQHLKNYITIFHPEKNNEAYLFYTVIKGIMGKMSSGNVERLIQSYADKVRNTGVSIPEKVYPHMFRRTRATTLYQNGVELELISKILGHSMTETTKIYAKPSIEQMRSAMESVEIYTEKEELPMWDKANEEEMAHLFGLR